MKESSEVNTKKRLEKKKLQLKGKNDVLQIHAIRNQMEGEKRLNVDNLIADADLKLNTFNSNSNNKL